MDFAGRGLAQGKTIGAARDRLSLCHPPRYEFRQKPRPGSTLEGLVCGRPRDGSENALSAGRLGSVGECGRWDENSRSALRWIAVSGGLFGSPLSRAAFVFGDCQRMPSPWLSVSEPLHEFVARRVAGENAISRSDDCVVARQNPRQEVSIKVRTRQPARRPRVTPEKKEALPSGRAS